MSTLRIDYTHTDEAPALATHSLLPIIRRFLASAEIEVALRDISLSGRILAAFRDQLPEAQQIEDALAALGELAKTPEANIIKLPNISASVPQLKEAIAELQAAGYALPNYPEAPTTDAERDTRSRYDKVKGSAVNPVLREGNSDRRAPKAVKAYARQYPHRMGAWSAEVRTHVATMEEGDFRHTERSHTLANATTARIEHLSNEGTRTILKEGISLQAGEIIDAALMRKHALLRFLDAQIAEAKAEGMLWSLHLKATMMKVSDPILFGHALRRFLAPFFAQHGAALDAAGVNPNNGLGALLAKLDSLEAGQAAALKDSLAATLAVGPALAMVDSDRGITNLHVPSDVIIDASMPAMIRDSGCMWNAAGERQETKAVIPDSSYAAVYQEVIDFCKAHGAFDPKTMGSVSNVGLMAQKAEEYGSHDKTFELAEEGTVRVVDSQGNTLLEHEVAPGDIWRMCQVKDLPVRDWVALAIRRARATQTPAVFWLDATRPHDAELIKKVQACLAEQDTAGLELPILAPAEATRFSLERMARGEDTVSVTGNVLRDYLTDLFPILEVGTSAKMLSIVPLLAGGGLFETGAGGSAPKHVQQFVEEGHLRWDSLGEFLALGASLEHIAEQHSHAKAGVLARTLDEATSTYLLENKSPSRKTGEQDNRGSHFYLALYWAKALSAQTDDAELATHFSPLAKALAEAEPRISQELLAAQGQPQSLGGYYLTDAERAAEAMRPSATLNALFA